MYAIRKQMKDGDVYVALPVGNVLDDNIPQYQFNANLIQWALDHAIDYGWRDGIIYGVFLSSEDLTAFKLMFG